MTPKDSGSGWLCTLSGGGEIMCNCRSQYGRFIRVIRLVSIR